MAATREPGDSNSTLTLDTAAVIQAIQNARPEEKPVQQVSLDQYQQSPATVRFRRWTAHGGTAYMRGQECGVSLGEASQLERHGAADVVHTRTLGPAMITK